MARQNRQRQQGARRSAHGKRPASWWWPLLLTLVDDSFRIVGPL
jgi:hypothetical protein